MYPKRDSDTKLRCVSIYNMFEGHPHPFEGPATVLNNKTIFLKTTTYPSFTTTYPSYQKIIKSVHMFGKRFLHYS